MRSRPAANEALVEQVAAEYYLQRQGNHRLALLPVDLGGARLKKYLAPRGEIEPLLHWTVLDEERIDFVELVLARYHPPCGRMVCGD